MNCYAPRVVANFETGQVLNNLLVSGPAGAILLVNGLDLAGVILRFDSPSAPAILWPADTPFWALGFTAQSLYLSGTVPAGGSLVFAGEGFRLSAAPPNPQPVKLPAEPGTAVVDGSGGVTSNPVVIAGGYDQNNDPQGLRLSSDGCLTLAAYNGGGQTFDVANPHGAIDGGYQNALAAGGFSATLSLPTNQAIAAGGNLAFQVPMGSPRHWRRAVVVLNLSASAGNLVLQASYFDSFSGQNWYTILGGASGAGLAAGYWTYGTDGLRAAELTGKSAGTIMPAWIPAQQQTQMFRLLNLSGSVGETFTGGTITVDNL
jgi:hypothetical protein